MFNTEKFRNYLQQNNITQSEMARMLRVSEGTVRHIVVGIKQPSFYMACQIADIMGETLDSMRVAEKIQ